MQRNVAAIAGIVVGLYLTAGCGSPGGQPARQTDVQGMDDDQIRQFVRDDLARLGQDECSGPLKAALMNKDAEVRTYALDGILEGIEKDWCTPGFRAAAFEILVDLVDREHDHKTLCDAPTCLLALDRDRAMPILLSERYFSMKNPNLHLIVSALCRRKVPVPAELLLPLLEELRPAATNYPHTDAYGDGLVLLARTKDPSAERLVREAMESEDRTVHNDAAEAWCALHGLDDPFTFVCRRLDQIGWENVDKLTEPQRLVYCVVAMDNDVRNGGFSQYFWNSSSDFAADALAGLETINDKPSADILRQAMRPFGKDGPARDRELRWEQLSMLSQAQREEFERLGPQFWRDKDHLRVKIALYAVRHSEHFH